MARGRALDVAAIIGELQAEQFVVVASLDPTGQPALSAVSWLRGRPPDAVDMLVGRTSQLLKNARRNPRVTIGVFGSGLYSLKGHLRVLQDEVPELPIPLAWVRVDVFEAADGMFTGGTLTAGPTVVKAYPEKLKDLDARVNAFLDAPGAATAPAAAHRSRDAGN
jgi:hypothetical protein